MKLFKMENWDIIVAEEAYLLTPFKKILQADKTKDKEIATKEMAFIWFYADLKSTYNYILDDSEKIEEIKKDLNLPKDWKPSKLVLEGISFYKERSKTVSSTILENSLFIANSLSDKMKKIIEEDNELSISDMEKVSKGLVQMPNIVSSIQKLEQTVLREQAEHRDKSGSKDRGLFEDGI